MLELRGILQKCFNIFADLQGIAIKTGLDQVQDGAFLFFPHCPFSHTFEELLDVCIHFTHFGVDCYLVDLHGVHIVLFEYQMSL